MADYDAASFAEQVALLGLLSRQEVSQALRDADDGTMEALARSFLRKGMLTSWQVEKLKKGEVAGFIFGDSKVLFHLAEGTFARVYRGLRIHGHQPVAIKVLRNRFTVDPSAIERFNREAQAGMKLVHPNIVRIYDYGAQDNRHYMTMEYVEGSNLRDFLKFRKQLNPKEAMPLILGLARGLQYSLSKGVTHRDIKGTNILVASNGTAKLVDFGLATIEGEDRKMAVAHGQRTVDYSALERTCNSQKGDPRSDIYFLGCVYYQMITGQLPLPEVETSDPLAKMLKRSFGAIKPISEMRHAPEPELCRIIEKMMKVDLARRYQNMEEVVADLEAFVTQVTGAVLPRVVVDPAEQDDLDLENPFARDFFVQEKDEPLPEVDPDDFNLEPAPPFEAPTVKPKQVLCVEAQDTIRDAFRKSLTKMGYRPLLVSDAEVAAERYAESSPEAVVFDVDGLGPEAIEALLEMHEKAHEDGHDLVAVVLLGPRQGDLAQQLPTDDRLVVLTKPVKMKDVQKALTRLVSANTR
ncbi:serine/threonine-protein kinase [soil metagenome]